MGIIDKIRRKIGNKMEDLGKKGMTEEVRVAYENERASLNDERKKLDYIDQVFEKNELKDLENLLLRIGALDDKKIWISGFQQKRINQNPKTANLFTGKKNMRFLTFNNDKFYMLYFEKNHIKSSRVFNKDFILKAKIDKNFKLELKDGIRMDLAITENKKMANKLLELM